jgi:hypothetical protein
MPTNTKPKSTATKRTRKGKGGAVPNSKRPKNAARFNPQTGNTTLNGAAACDIPDIGHYSEESIGVACTREQLIDVETLTHYVCSLGANVELKKACKALLEGCEVTETNTAGEPELIGKVKVEYMHQIVNSRIYPARYNWWNDIFSQQRDARGAAGWRIYVDLDMENCFPVLLEFLCTKHGILAPKLMEYNKKRDEYIGQVIAHYQPKASNQRKATKALFSAGYNGAGKDFISNWREEHSVHKDIDDHPFVVGFFSQNSEVAKKLIVEHYNDVLDEVKAAMPHKDRPIQTALHCVLARLETQCRDTVERVANNQTISPNLRVRMDSAQHDGAYFRVDTSFEGRDWYRRHAENMKEFDWGKLCEHMSAAIKEEHGYTVTVVVKKSIKKPEPFGGTSIFRISDFVPNLPFKRQMNWLNRHFCMLAGQGTDGVAKIEYVPGSDNIHEAVTQPTSSFKQTFAGMMVPVSMLEGKHPATPSVAEGPLDEGPDEGTFETAADGSHDDPNEASEDDHAEIKSPGPSS